MDALPKQTRIRLLAHLSKLRQFPEGHSDYNERDGIGRRLEISVFAGYALHYWIDSADCHVKVLGLKPADA